VTCMRIRRVNQSNFHWGFYLDAGELQALKGLYSFLTGAGKLQKQIKNF